MPLTLRPRGLWHRAEEGMWLPEDAALAELRDPVDCGCRGDRAWCFGGWPRHILLVEVRDPRSEFEVLGPGRIQHAGEPPVVRFGWSWRDAFGRFEHRCYVWRPDVEEFVEWRARHLAQRSAEMLAEKAVAE